MSPTDQPLEPEQAISATRWGRSLRRTAKLAAISTGLLFALIFLCAICLRLYYNDERVRRIAQETLSDRLQAKVTIDTLEISLLSGFELGGFSIGPPDGFEHEVIAFRRFAIRWSAAYLLLLRLQIDELALEGLRTTFEETDAGRNIDALQRALTGPKTREPKSDSPAEPKTPSEKKPRIIKQPSFPVHVHLEKLLFSLDSARVIRPDLEIEIDRIGAEGSFDGNGEALDLNLWFGLGDRDEKGKSSRLVVRGERLPGGAEIGQRLGVELTSGGVGDLRIDIGWNATIETGGEKKLPPFDLSAGMELSADLLQQKMTIPYCFLKLGELTSFAFAAEMAEILIAPTVHVSKLSAHSDFGELSPLVKTFAKGVTLSGELEISAEPFDVSLGGEELPSLDAAVRFELAKFAASTPKATVEGLNAVMLVSTNGEKVVVDLSSTLAKASTAKQRVRTIAVDLQVTTPLDPWMGGPVIGVVETKSNMRVARFESAAGSARGIRLGLTSVVPIELIKNKRADEPLDAQMTVHLAEARSPKGSARQIEMKLDARSWDLAGNLLEMTFTSRVGEALQPLGEETIRFTENRFDLQMKRHGQRFVIRDLRGESSGAFHWSASGTIDQALGPIPSFEKLKVTFGPIDLAGALQLLPESRRPPATVSGNAEMVFEIDGQVAHRKLLAALRPPKIEKTGHEEDPSKLVQGYADYLQRWATRIGEGLPFKTSCRFALEDVAFSDAKNEVIGLNLDVRAFLEADGPGITSSLTIGKTVRPIAASEIQGLVDLRFTEAGFDMKVEGGAGEVVRENLPRPLSGAGMKLAMSLDLDGDLVLDQFLMEAPDRGAKIEAHGVVSKPLRFALARGWAEPGIPGMDATLRWSAELKAGELRPISIGGPSVGGEVGWTGSLRFHNGLLALEGLFSSKDFSATAGKSAIDGLSGSLPFELQLAFDPRPDATILARNVPLGSGVIALLTAGDEGEERHARPVYYERLQPYRKRGGITARSLKSGLYEVQNFELEGRLTRGMLVTDWVAMHVLGGDITGNMALRLGRDASVSSEFAFKASNIDASYFKALNLQPGPKSELTADLQFGLLFAPRRRDLTLNMNVTKIGAETLDRFLQLLDPEGKNKKIQKTRSNLGWVRIDNVASWIRYENFNMDIAVTTFARIPGTNIGFPNIDRELLRRYSLTDRLDEALQPHVDKWLAPYLGWHHAS